jgi:hypothetical protein
VQAAISAETTHSVRLLRYPLNSAFVFNKDYPLDRKTLTASVFDNLLSDFPTPASEFPSRRALFQPVTPLFPARPHPCITSGRKELFFR